MTTPGKKGWWLKRKGAVLPTVGDLNHSVEGVLCVAQINAGRIEVDLRPQDLAVLANKHVPIHRPVEELEGCEQVLAEARVGAAQVVGQRPGGLDDRLLHAGERPRDDEGADAVPLGGGDLGVARVERVAGGGDRGRRGARGGGEEGREEEGRKEEGES